MTKSPVTTGVIESLFCIDFTRFEGLQVKDGDAFCRSKRTKYDFTLYSIVAIIKGIFEVLFLDSKGGP